jgi:hypothetical protein
MISFVLAVIIALICIAVLVGLYHLVVWVLAYLGVPVPPMVLKIAMLVIGLLILYYLIATFAGGGAGMPFPARW